MGGASKDVEWLMMFSLACIYVQIGQYREKVVVSVADVVANIQCANPGGAAPQK